MSKDHLNTSDSPQALMALETNNALVEDLEKGAEEQPQPEKSDDGSEKAPDPNIVDWDGPDDPSNPMNWPKSKREGHVVIVSVITLIVLVLSIPMQLLSRLTPFRNLGATMFAPGVADLMQDFHQTDSTLGSFTVSIYLLGLGLGPLFIAPMSELYGRLPVYHICNSFFIIFFVACAVSTDVGMFLAFRFITGVAGSCPVALGGGTIADVIPQEKRGGAMALFALGPLIGPIIGPVIGGFVAQYIGWRWTFRILAIVVSFYPPNI